MNLPLALSDGNHFDHGRPARLPDKTADRDKWLNHKEKAKLRHLEQRAAHRKSFRKKRERSSNRLRNTYDQIKRLRATATRRAVDWQHKATTCIAEQYGTVVVEQLNITNMVKSARGTVEEPGKNVEQKAGLNRSIGQEAWGRMGTMLTYKLAHRGGTLHKVPAPGTSLRCSACGFTTPGSRRTRPRSCARTPAAASRRTPTGTRPGTSCTCTRSAMWRSRLPEGAVVRRGNASSPPPQGRWESPGFSRESTSMQGRRPGPAGGPHPTRC